MFGKMMVRVLLAAALVASAVTVQASVFSLPNGETSLQFVPVGDTGNVADTTGLGAVSYRVFDRRMRRDGRAVRRIP